MISRNPKLSIAASLVGAAMLAACTLPPASYMVYGERYHPGYDFGELQFYNGDKEMQVEVFNTPFADPVAGQKIALAMRGKNRGSRIYFTAEPGPTTPRQTKILLAFDMKGRDDGYSYCGDNTPGKAQVPADAPMHLVMVYCKRNGFVSSVRARMPRPGSVDDPDFRNMLAEVTRRLLPQPSPLNLYDRREETKRILEIIGY